MYVVGVKHSKLSLPWPYHGFIREFKDVVFEDVVLENTSVVAI